MFLVYVFTHVLRFPVDTIIAWIIDNYHEQGNIIITILLLPLGHISNNDSSHSPWGPLGRNTPPDGPRYPSRHSRYTTEVPETFPVTKTGLPIYQSLPPDHFGAPRDVWDLIRDSEQPSVTTIHNSILPKRHRTLSVQTLRVRELCRHDRDTSTVNNQ